MLYFDRSQVHCPGVVAPDMVHIDGSNKTKPCFLDFTVFCI